MTSETSATETDRWIDALRIEQDRLAERVRALRADELAGPSACTEWSIAHVLSHLGAGAELMTPTIDAARAGTVAEPIDTQALWARWSARSPSAQADAFLECSERVVAVLEGLDANDRANLRAAISFLPEPADVATVAALRLNELTLHAWDVFVMDDPATPLTPSSVDLLIDRADVLIGFIGHPEAVEPRPVRVAVETVEPIRSIGMELADQVVLTAPPADPSTTATLPAEAFLRLVAGRLPPEHTPSPVSVSGVLTLDDLRRVFPGF